MAREPHGDNTRQNTEHQFQHHRHGEVDQRVTVALFTFITVAAHKARRNLRQDTGDKDNEGVHHALNQRHGHHVAVGNMADFVSDDRFGFVTAHVLQQPGADSNQRCITTGTRGKRVNIGRMINGHLRHGDPGLTGLLSHRIHQPLFHIVTRLLNHLTADGFQRHPL